LFDVFLLLYNDLHFKARCGLVSKEINLLTTLHEADVHPRSNYNIVS